MKTLLAFALIAIPFQFSSTALAKEGDVREVVIGINDAYIPSGFDSSSDAFVVVNGWLPNSCYRVKGVEVVHAGPTLHEVTTKASVTEGLCLTVIIPFHKEAQLGKLGVGTHQVRFVSSDGTYMEKQIAIEN